MKEIKLKPKLEVGEKVIFQEVEFEYRGILHDMAQLVRHGYQPVLLHISKFDIIESPAEKCNHCNGSGDSPDQPSHEDSAAPTPVNPQITDAECEPKDSGLIAKIKNYIAEAIEEHGRDARLSILRAMIETELERIEEDHFREVTEKVGQSQDKVASAAKELSLVYSERAKILAALAFHLASDKSRKFKVGTAQHPIEDKDWDDDWRTILVIELPEQIQLTWHFSDDDKYLLDSLQPIPNYKWDGHTTEEKYKRLIDWFLPVTVSAPQTIKEEKPLLKLRVGGIYKNGNSNIEEIEKINTGGVEFIAKSGRKYSDRGFRFIGGIARDDHICNLIEEVQPDKANDATYCECPVNTMSFEDSPGIRKCDNCHQLSKQRTKSDPSEIEALRKENEELNKHVLTVLHGSKIIEDHFKKENALLKAQNAELVEAAKKPNRLRWGIML